MARSFALTKRHELLERMDLGSVDGQRQLATHDSDRRAAGVLNKVDTNNNPTAPAHAAGRCFLSHDLSLALRRLTSVIRKSSRRQCSLAFLSSWNCAISSLESWSLPSRMINSAQEIMRLRERSVKCDGLVQRLHSSLVAAWHLQDATELYCVERDENRTRAPHGPILAPPTNRLTR